LLTAPGHDGVPNSALGDRQAVLEQLSRLVRGQWLTISVIAVIAVAVAVGHNGLQGDDPEFGLANLVDNPFEEGDHLLTPLEESRRAFEETFKHRQRSHERPEITGITLVLRAILEFQDEERETAIDDAVRQLRRHPDLRDKVWQVVATWQENNPHLAPRVAQVKAEINRKLARKPARRLEWLKF